MRRDPYFYVMIAMMLPIFFTGTLTMWMMDNLTIIPKGVSERTFYLISYIVIALLAIGGAVVYLLNSRNSNFFFPVFICCSFVVGKVVINYLSRRIFNEDFD